MIERPNGREDSKQREYMSKYLRVAARVREVDTAAVTLRRRLPNNGTVATLHSLTGKEHVRLSTMRRWSEENDAALSTLGERYERASGVLKKYGHLYDMPEEGVQELLSALREE